ncbi:hypothetical protein EGW08_008453 [Elysia chlorotica]|uniref:Uncharacterized protein n=1 Tax=Elysia chlorotica TaxID=188477 RepID=A0A3S0ZPE7_ELYCH|nr:hypothetical protein EGW08_008453 [Elysia chlorotica]
MGCACVLLLDPGPHTNTGTGGPPSGHPGRWTHNTRFWGRVQDGILKKGFRKTPAEPRHRQRDEPDLTARCELSTNGIEIKHRATGPAYCHSRSSCKSRCTDCGHWPGITNLLRSSGGRGSARRCSPHGQTQAAATTCPVRPEQCSVQPMHAMHGRRIYAEIIHYEAVIAIAAAGWKREDVQTSSGDGQMDDDHVSRKPGEDHAEED